MQKHEVLDRLRRAARSQQMAAFRGEVFLRGDAVEAVLQRHTETALTLHLLTELCQHPGDVAAGGYSEQQSV